MSISHEILTDHEGDHFSIEYSSKVQENSSNHNIEQSSSSISKELRDSDIYYSVNPLIDIESTIFLKFMICFPNYHFLT